MDNEPEERNILLEPATLGKEPKIINGSETNQSDPNFVAQILKEKPSEPDPNRDDKDIPADPDLKVLQKRASQT